jgi:hypothetical protein
MLLAAILFAATLESQQPCFDASSNRDLPFEVLEQAPAPREAAQAGYRYYPLTAAASMDLDSLNRSRAAVGRYFFLWANRCHDLGSNHGECGWNKKGNVVFPRLATDAGEVRTFFTSFRKANACTLAQAARILDYPAKTVEDYGRRAQLTMVVKGTDVLKHARDNRLVDICLLEKEPLTPAGAGILLDYEVQDNRTPDQTLAFLKEFTALVHGKGKKAILLTNPLDAPTQFHTGVTPANARAICDAFDRITIFLWHNNKQNDLAASARAQLAMVRAGGKIDGKKLLALFELNYTTMAEAETARRMIQSEGMAGVMFWRNYAEQGGPCDSGPNRKIACVVFGKCAAGQ